MNKFNQELQNQSRWDRVFQKKESSPETSYRKPRLRSLLPDKPNFYRPPGEESNSPASRETSDSASDFKPSKPLPDDLLNFERDLQRRETELQRKESFIHEKQLQLNETEALLQAKQKLLQQKERRLSLQFSPEKPPVEKKNAEWEKRWESLEQEKEKLQEREIFLQRCEELLFSKSQEISEKLVKLEQWEEEIHRGSP